VIYHDQRGKKDIENDKELTTILHNLLDEADIVVTHNGKQFDIKRINERIVIHGMRPPSSYKQVDTKVLAKNKFGFASNKLEHLANKLCTKNKKLKHSEFPGHELWTECLKQNPKAWNEMKKYNIADVLTLEELFLKLRPWDTSINFGVYLDGACSCGSTKFHRNGFTYTNSGKYQRYSCAACGAEHRDSKNVLDKTLNIKRRVA
jgi:hypothetical protein